MATQTQQTNLFYGGVIKRIFVIVPQNHSYTCSKSLLELIKTRFNTIRNYREFSHDCYAEVSEYTSDNLPRIQRFKENDACLLIGNGRFIDKATYEFARKCSERKVPIYFIRSNSLDTDPRVSHNHIWRVPYITIQTETQALHYGVPEKYFMQIPEFTDIILLQSSNDYYALLPGMVPFSLN